MTPTPDPTIPDRGDPITMLGGQFSGQHGTMLRRNGTSAQVALHAPAHVIVQALDGSVWAARMWIPDGCTPPAGMTIGAWASDAAASFDAALAAPERLHVFSEEEFDDMRARG